MRKMDNDSIKKRIAGLRLSRGLKQKDIANAMGISRNSYRAIEKGDTRILFDKLEDLSRCLGCSEEELILGYVPQEMSPLELAASDNHAKQLHDMAQDYENRLEEMREKLREKEDMIRALKDACDSKEEIISLLHKNRP